MAFSESFIIHRARAGDRAAFGSLYDRHAPRIYNLLRRLTASESEAEDLTQETFLTAWQRLGDWQGRGQFGTWLCGIAVRHAQNRQRYTSRRESEPLDTELSSEAAASDPFLYLSSSELAERLESAIRALPDGCRAVFVLIKVEGWTQREAAQCLEIPLGTVQSRLHRAVQLLRVALSETLEKSLISPQEEERLHALPHRV